MNKKTSVFFGLRIKFLGLLTAGGAVACVSTVFGFLGRFSWFFDLFSHFRVQYVIGLSIIAILMLGGRWFKTAAVFSGFACINLALILPLYFGGASENVEAAPELRAMLLNVNTSFGDSHRVREVISAADPDILVLEEISSRWMSDLVCLKDSHPYSLVQPREDNFGIGIFSKLPISEGEVINIGDAGVPSIIAILNSDHAKLSVIATHPLPPGGRDYSRRRNEQLKQLPEYIRPHLPTLLIGDLNVTPWNSHFRRLLSQTGLSDSAKGFGVQPTWPNYNFLLRIPIDHCLHSENIAITNRQVGEDVSSDHFPLIVDFVIRTE